MIPCRKPVVVACFTACGCRTMASNSSGLKQVMRCLPQPVVVVTSASVNARHGIVRRGVTCSSFVSISLAPPTVSISIYSGNIINEMIEKSAKFTANILTDKQVSLGMHFAKPLSDDLGYNQFETIPHTDGTSGIPVLDGALGIMQCDVTNMNMSGDHNVWYGQVSSVGDSSNNSAQPLLYYQRTFCSIGDEIFMTAFETTTMPFIDWTHEAHLRMAWNYLVAFGKEEATPKIREGIRKFNEKNKHLVTHGYNETVTSFYVHVIYKCILTMPDGHTFEDLLACNPYLQDSDYLWKFYSPSVIQDKLAKTVFLEPDICNLP